MKKFFPLLLLCAAIAFTACSSDDDKDKTIAVTGVVLDQSALALEVGQTATLAATISPEDAATKEVMWSSSQTEVATVVDGVVTAVKVGEAIITVTTKDGAKTDECTVTVTAATIAVTGVTLNKTALALKVGEKETLTATIIPADATIKTVTWSSSDAAIATIDATTGEVTAVAKGETTITATSTSNPAVTATCQVTVEDKPITWAVGNLVADGANGAKIGTATDGGLFFQFGSLVGWSTTGSPTVAVSPVGYTGSTTWNKDWTGDPATENVATGTGDPCKYYLKGTWRLPTNDEYKALFNNVTDGSYANSGGWSWDAIAKTATNNTKNLTFPASGYRSLTDGSLSSVGTVGFYWSASPINASNGYILFFNSSGVNPSSRSNRATGYPVRCVQASL